MSALLLAWTIGGIGLGAPAAGQDAPPPAPGETRIEPVAPGEEIVVTGRRERGSAILDIAPVAVLNADAIMAQGVPNIAELLKRLKPLTTSASGSDPVYLLNGLRVSGPEELYSIPPEAMEKTEILSEQDSARFGYPTTVRVLNFITKKRFRSITLQQLAGTTTDGGGATNYAEVNSTRIDGPRRTTLGISHFRQNRVLQSQRDIAPDPDAVFAIPGNVVGHDGDTIGRRVVSDLGPYRTLQPRLDTVRVDGTIAAPIGRAVSGSLNLSMEAQQTRALNGLAPAILRVPAGNPTLSFAQDVSLYRYFPDAALRQRSTNLNLHAGGTVQGSYRRWTWNVTSSFDRVRSTAISDQGVPTDALQAAIDAGGNPLAMLDPATAAERIRDRSRTVTGTLVGKAVANGPVMRLPAGDALVTVSADYARSASDRNRAGAGAAIPDLTRTTRGASVNVDVPILSPDRDIAPFLGRLSANGTIGVSGVSDYGRLINSSYGMTWTPVAPVQVTASVNEARTPPAIALLTGPLLASPNTPFFDFATGTTVAVTALSGGRPGLAPEERRIVSIGTSVKPFKATDFRVGIDYLDTRTFNQTAFFSGATIEAQAAFPGLFLRDPLGQLVQADLRAVNLARERERKLRMTINFSGQLGPPPPPPPAPPLAGAAAPDPAAPPPKPPKRRPSIYSYGTATWRFDDRLNLQPGSPTLDLLDGASVNGTQGRPRWELDGNVGASIDMVNVGLYGRLQGPTRIRSLLAASDLRFSARTWLVLYGSVDIAKLVDRPWTQRMMMHLTIENLLNDRIDVRDRTGATPNRYQGAYLDPLGRSIRLGVRKLF